MRAARYRLRFHTGATLTTTRYGGGTYGAGTYGMTASDALTTAHHRLVPWPAGAMTVPSWRYRQNDTQPPLQAQVIADDGVVDYTGLQSAMLILTAIDDPAVSLVFELAVVIAPNGDQRLQHIWRARELSIAGVFRASVVLVYTSGRWMSVPAQDQHYMTVLPNGS